VLERLAKIGVILVLLFNFSDGGNLHGKSSKQLLLPAKGIRCFVFRPRLVLEHKGKLMHEINLTSMACVEVLLGVNVAERIMISVKHKFLMDKVVPPVLEGLHEGIKF